MNALTLRHAHTVPAILANAGENAATKFLEFFAARIRNLNTREAYARACAQFLAWSENHVDDIRLITPMHVAAYIEQHPGSPQTIKQHLAAIKMLFDYLVISQIVPINPAAPVKGPTYVVKRGKTPVLSVEDARRLLGSIPSDSLQGLRDRALISVMLFSFARVSAVLTGYGFMRKVAKSMKCRLTTRSKKRSMSTCPKSVSTTISRYFRV